MNDSAKGSLFLIAAMLIFGLMGIFAKSLLASPLMLLYSFEIIGLITYSLVLLKTKKFRVGGVLKIVFVMTLFNLLSDFSFFSAVKLTSVANAVFIKFTGPIFILILAPLIIGEKRERRSLYAVPLALVGLFLIIYQNNLMFDANMVGMGFALITAISFAVFLILIKKITKSLDLYTMLFYRFLIATIILTPLVFLSSPAISSDMLVQLALFGILFITIGTTIHLQGVKRIPVQRSGILGYIEPLSAAIYGIFLLSEIPTIFTLIGGALILLSSYLIVRN